MQDIKDVLINPFQANLKLLQKSALSSNSTEALKLNVSQVPGTNLNYDIGAELEGYDSTKQVIRWEINAKEIPETTVNLKNILLVDGENTIEVSVIEDGIYVSTLLKHFDTNESAPVDILDIETQPVKYSDGLHYNFIGSYQNINYAEHKVYWYLNGKYETSPANVLVKEGSNTILARVLNREDKKILDERLETFTAEKSAVRIVHLVTVMGTDKNHYDFVSLYKGYNSNVHDLVWTLNGDVIDTTNNVAVPDGVNTINFAIKDKETGKIISQESKEWNTEEAVGIILMNSYEIPDADDMHYKFSASFINYDENRHDLVWALNGTQIQDPNNVELSNGPNKVILYVYSKENQELLAAKNEKVNLDVEVPDIENIYINTDGEQGLTYNFTQKTDNYSSKKHSLMWVLNGVELGNPTNVTLNGGLNTIKLNVINNYTNKIIDTSNTDFIADGKGVTYNSITYHKPMGSKKSTEVIVSELNDIPFFTEITHIASVEAIGENKLKFVCQTGYNATKEMDELENYETINITGNSLEFRHNYSIDESSWSINTNGQIANNYNTKVTAAGCIIL